MTRVYKNYLLFVIAFLLLAAAFIWQYQVSKQTAVNDYKPMRIEILLEPMTNVATTVAGNSKYVYIGSSNEKVTVESSKVDVANKRITLVLSGTGVIYDDSAFFAGQRLVFNTKIKIHALFDDVGTVTNLEYTK